MDGATTVSGTVFAAASAGIDVVATGGIGGVHRGDTGDVSADLPTLAHHAVAVVAAGAKSILDLPRTLEALETLGVPVVGLGTRDFPPSTLAAADSCSTSRPSGRRHRPVLFHSLASAWAAGGVLVACPCPEEQALKLSEVEEATAHALRDATAEAVSGKPVTPWLLASIAESLGARVVATNHALLLNNARIGARIAIALCELSAASTSVTRR